MVNSFLSEESKDTSLASSLDLFPWHSPYELDYDPIDIEIELLHDPVNKNLNYLRFKKPKKRLHLTHSLQNSQGYSYDHIPSFHTYYPLTSSLLEQPEIPVSLNRLEYLEKRRLKAFITLVEISYPREYAENTLFHEIGNIMDKGGECDDIRELIENHKYNTNKVVWSILSFVKQQQYTNLSQTPSFRKDLDKYGNTSYLMLVLKYMIDSNISEFTLRRMWSQLFSYTLQMFGFSSRYLLSSRYNTQFIWKHLNDTEMLDPDFQVVTIKVGSTIIHKKQLWMRFKGEDTQLYTTPVKNRFGIQDYAYTRIMDPKKIQAAFDEYEEDNESYSVEIQVIQVGSYKYILYFRGDEWKLLGKYHEFIVENEVQGFFISEGILSIPVSAQSTAIAEQEVLNGIRLKNIVQAYGILSASYNTISLDIYQLKHRRGKKICGKFLDFRDYTSPHDLIDDLRAMKGKYCEAGKTMYFLNPVDNIEWKGWTHLRNLVSGFGKISEEFIPKDGHEFLFRYEDLLYDDREELKVTLTIKHIDYMNEDGSYDCPLFEFDEDTKFRYIRAQHNGGSVPESYRHGDCFHVSSDLPKELTFSPIRPKLQKIQGLANAHDIYEAVTQEVPYDDKYIVKFRIEEDPECGEEYWFRRMFKELGEDIQWRAIGSVDMTEEYSLESVKQKGYSVYFEFINAAGKRWQSWPVGHKEIHTRIELFKFELGYQRENFTGVDVEGFEEKVKGLQLTIDEHLADCDDNIHSINLEEEMLYSPDTVQYGNPKFETFKMTLLLKDLNEITVYVEIEFDGIEEAIDVVEGEMEKVIEEGIDFGNNALLSVFDCEYDIQDYYNSKSCEILVDMATELIEYELISHERQENFYQIIETLGNIITTQFVK